MYKEFVKISLHNHLGNKNKLDADRTIDKDFNNISFDLEISKKFLDDAIKLDFSVIAMTNHNVIHYDEYKKLKEIYKEDLTILPGVELDIKSENNSYFHTVVIFDDKNHEIIKEKSGIINNFVKENKKKNEYNYVTVEQFYDILVGIRAIIVPHGLKNDGIDPETDGKDNIEAFKEILEYKNTFPIFIENNRVFHFKELQIRLNNYLEQRNLEYIKQIQTISAADQTSLSKILEPTYFWGKGTFNDIYYSGLITSDRMLTENDIVKKSQYISKIKITQKNNDKTFKEVELKLSHGLNTIIGKSGSGKTLLLNLINKKLTGEDLKNTPSANYKNDYDNLYEKINVSLFDLNGNVIENGIKPFSGQDIYGNIIKTINKFDENDENNVTNEVLDILGIKTNNKKFNEYIESVETKFNKYIRVKRELKSLYANIDSKLTSFGEDNKFLINNRISKYTVIYSENTNKYVELSNKRKEILSYIKDKNLLVENVNAFKMLLEKYNIYDEKKFVIIKDYYDELDRVIDSRITTQRKVCRRLGKEILLNKKISDIVTDFNKEIGTKDAEIQIRSNRLTRNITSIVSGLKEIVALSYTDTKVGLDANILENSVTLLNKKVKAELEMNEKISMCKREDLKEIFGNIGRKKNEVKESEFGNKDKMYDLTIPSSVCEILDIITNKSEENVYISRDYTNYLNQKVKLNLNEEGYVYLTSLSSGQIAKYYLENMIESKLAEGTFSSILLFDQPDTNLGKGFVHDTLMQKLKEFRKQYQVILTTHEPLLVINADSNNILHARNLKNISTHNRFEYENYSYSGDFAPESVDDIIDNLSKMVDGSPNAIFDRSNLYKRRKL
ncbi:hypothetical protein ACAG96_03520 [Candidatus Izemoplasma sp. B36]|uniref:hypothetical protein n=1 Tax=Candidatus Izemoplasma sp. B36 TaxID=3242468 RepID=UPI0035562642